MNDALFELENLTVRAEGLASMAMALREAFFVGENAPETYNNAIDLFAVLMYEFAKELNKNVVDLRHKESAQG